MFFWDFAKMFRTAIPCRSYNNDVISSFQASLNLFGVFYKSYKPNAAKIALAEKELNCFVKGAWLYKEFIIITFQNSLNYFLDMMLITLAEVLSKSLVIVLSKLIWTELVSLTYLIVRIWWLSPLLKGSYKWRDLAMVALSISLKLVLIKYQCCPHIESSELISTANQLTGF